jgi:acyl dehydratase
MSKERYYEDFEVGQQLLSRGEYLMDKESTIAFAKEFDPQPMHIDEVSSRINRFGGLIASGWHTAAATMRLKTETDLANIEGGLLGLGAEDLRWPQPTRPGDTLRLVITVLEKRLSKSKPGFGVIKYKAQTLNQRNEVAMEMTTAVLAPCRKQ